jgi:cyclopropane fatty-acyl-phospholipid synthase-like methyltransferase
MDTSELAERVHLDRYPRSNRYDPVWVAEHMMGPNPLWLMEHLTNLLDLHAGQRVMDLGCGKALTSVFLAREFDVRVQAVDLWIPAGDDWARITGGEPFCEQEAEMLRADVDGLLGFVAVVATKTCP